MPETIPKHVLISDRSQLGFWCRYFDCSVKDLEDAVSKIGSCPEEIKLYLRKKPGKKGLAFWWEFMK